MAKAETTVAPPASLPGPQPPRPEQAVSPAPAPVVSMQGAPLSAEDIADAAQARAATYARDASAAGVCVADGMGLALRVERGALVVEDGMGDQRRTRRFDKATHGLSRLVVIGSSGYWTLDAMHWCRRLGVGVLVLAPDGTAAMASTPRVGDDARLRRAQAGALGGPVGLGIARLLIGAKLAGQARVLRARFGDTSGADTMDSLAAAVEVAADIEEVRQLEATGAALYWQRWAGRPEAVPRFATKDRRRIPAHWTRYDGRRSVLASVSSNRKAERPVNALLNYTYALLEAEATLACVAVGLDPGLGVLHADTKGRQSLALDLMEPVRPAVDDYVLDLVASRTFRKVEFTETPDGHVRLMAPLTHDLAESLARWSRAVAPLAERVAHCLGDVIAGRYDAATPLTGSRTRAAQAVVKARKAAAASAAASSPARQRPAAKATVAAPWICPDCGGEVSDSHRVRCDACIDADPAQSPAIRATRARAISGRRQREAAWSQVNRDGAPVGPEWVAEALRPALAGVTLRRVVDACHVTKSTASSWRNGHTTPHPMHWRILAELAGVALPDRSRIKMGS